MPLTVEDKLELMALPGLYGNAIDDRDWGALRRIFTQDAVFDCTSAFDVKMVGLDEIVDFMDKTDRHPLAHLMTNIDITELRDEVSMRFRSIFPLMNEDGSTSPVRVKLGCYYDQLVRTAAGWRVKGRVYTVEPRDKTPTRADLQKEARLRDADV